MWFYRALSRLPFPRSYIGKILGVSFVGVHVPLLCLVAYLVTAAGLSTETTVPLLIVATLATVAGTGFTFVALYWLLAPMRAASQSIHEYLADRTVPALPTGFDDQAGQLLRDVQEGITRLDLALDQAEAAKQAVVQDSRSKFEVLSKLSHELRTPLNAIIGFSEVMQGEMLGPLGSSMYKGYAGDIKNSGHDLALQIQSLLDVSQIEAGDVVIRAELVQIGEHINQAIGLKHLHATRLGIALQGQHSDLPVAFACDPSILKQALLNLISSSILSTEEGGQVLVGCRRIGSGIEISVTDTGRRLDDEDVSAGMVFESGAGMSERRRQTPIDVASASNIALPLLTTHTLARLAGGSLSIANLPDGGKSFRLRLSPAELEAQPYHVSDDTALEPRAVA